MLSTACCIIRKILFYFIDVFGLLIYIECFNVYIYVHVRCYLLNHEPISEVCFQIWFPEGFPTDHAYQAVVKVACIVPGLLLWL